MGIQTTVTVVQQLHRHQILIPAHLANLDVVAERFPNALDLARELVRCGWLTSYQSELLLQDKAVELILGPFVLLEPLGEGGMGRVYKARHNRMGRTVALKVILPAVLANPKAVECFVREGQAVAQLVHPNIAIAHDAGQVGDTHFLAMEYVEGTDLSQVVRESGPLPISQACDLSRQAALGLQHAHEKGLVHRDIKPSNLMLTASGVVKILDFGLARFESEVRQTGRLTQLGKLVGTVDFIAPEQAMDARHADIRSDIYSLGCTLYFLLSGQPPFPGENVAQRLGPRMLGNVPSVRVLRPEVPAKADAVLAKMMAKEPSERYQTPAAAAKALAPFTTPIPGRKKRPAPPPMPVSSKPHRSAALTPTVTDQRSSISGVSPGSEGERSLRLPRPVAIRKRGRRILPAVGAIALLILAMFVAFHLYGRGLFHKNNNQDRVSTDGREQAKTDNPDASKEKKTHPTEVPDPAQKTTDETPKDDRTARPKAEKDPGHEPTKPETVDPASPRADLTTEEQVQVKKAVERGVECLKINQLANGTWNAGHTVGMAALPGLTLLECGVPGNESSVQKAASFVRNTVTKTTSTYEIALAILFLDRLGDKKDEALIRTLGLRLVAGQTTTGGWSYLCPIVDPKFEPGLLLVLEQTRPRNPLEVFVTGNDGKVNVELIGLDPKLNLSPEFLAATSNLDPDGPFRGVVDGISKNRPDGTPPTAVSGDDPRLVQKEKEKTDAARKAMANLPRELQRIPSLLPPSALNDLPRTDPSDNSNTQFAILGLLAAVRHDVPTERTMGLVVRRFRTSQNTDGTFAYHYTRGGGGYGGPGGAETMTAAGLLGLAVTHSLIAKIKIEDMSPKGAPDKSIQKALAALSKLIEPKNQAKINQYLLLGVERVGLIYDLPKIGNKDWYRWGVELLLNVQVKDGSWTTGIYPGATPMVNTCFALLFLKCANLAKDLTLCIQGRGGLTIAEK